MCEPNELDDEPPEDECDTCGQPLSDCDCNDEDYNEDTSGYGAGF